VILDIEDADIDKYIYRTISYDRLIELFQTNQNALVKPKKWDDTFENLILKSKLKTPSGEIIQYNIHDKIYGQCWTTEKSSDAMWRIYSTDKNGFRIRTTIRKLYDSFDLSLVDRASCLGSIGKVKYLNEAELTSKAKATFNPDGQITFGDCFRSLLLKRKAFRHENEVRLLFLDWSDSFIENDIFKYDIDPHSLISQITIDPRITYKKFSEIKSKIQKVTKYQGEIARSTLYKLPEDIVIEVNNLKT